MALGFRCSMRACKARRKLEARLLSQDVVVVYLHIGGHGEALRWASLPFFVLQGDAQQDPRLGNATCRGNGSISFAMRRVPTSNFEPVVACGTLMFSPCRSTSSALLGHHHDDLKTDRWLTNAPADSSKWKIWTSSFAHAQIQSTRTKAPNPRRTLDTGWQKRINDRWAGKDSHWSFRCSCCPTAD
ncbi:hypothetical protein L1887_51935 [Cichorium endivia]|nr:hypothetical protein L1887_51935 [Cichorium endivia]